MAGSVGQSVSQPRVNGIPAYSSPISSVPLNKPATPFIHARPSVPQPQKVKKDPWWTDDKKVVKVIAILLSIAWATLAGILVLSPKFKDVNSRLGIGLIIATLSVAKLILFDMDKLDGFVRALAFIICGLILLAMVVFGAKQQKGDRDRIGGASGPLLESDQSAASDRPVAGTPQADSWEMSPESNHRITGSSGSSRSSSSSQDSGTAEDPGNTEQEPN